jgi:hypothetical protein
MALEGNLRDFSSTEILQLIASQRKTGCLRVEDGVRRRSVYVVDGRIVSTRDGETLADDSLYRFLRRIQRLPDDQLRAIANLKDESGRDLEDLLVQGGYIEAEELERLIERQILDDLLEMIEWSRGTYQFDPERRWPQPVLVRLSIEASLIEAARRADERKRFQDLFQDGRQVVSVRDLPDPEEEIADEESELFGIIDGQHTVTEVVSLAPLTDYEASEALQRMIEAGWIEFLGRREAEAAPSPRPCRRPRPRPRRHSARADPGCRCRAKRSSLRSRSRASVAWRSPPASSRPSVRTPRRRRRRHRHSTMRVSPTCGSRSRCTTASTIAIRPASTSWRNRAGSMRAGSPFRAAASTTGSIRRPAATSSSYRRTAEPRGSSPDVAGCCSSSHATAFSSRSATWSGGRDVPSSRDSSSCP